MPLVLSAQRLSDGEVVYLTAAGAWSDRLDEAVTAESKADAAALEAQGPPFVTARVIVNPHLIEVLAENGRLIAKGAREFIRAHGPTVRTDLGKQARPEARA